MSVGNVQHGGIALTLQPFLLFILSYILSTLFSTVLLLILVQIIVLTQSIPFNRQVTYKSQSPNGDLRSIPQRGLYTMLTSEFRIISLLDRVLGSDVLYRMSTRLIVGRLIERQKYKRRRSKRLWSR